MPDFRSVSEALNRVEEGDWSTIEEALASAPTAWRVSLAGPPGVGKSTIIDSVGSHLVRGGSRVAVLAIDPSSPRSGGALLGDRIRMRRLEREGQFIRSMTSPGSRPRLWVTAYAAIKLLASSGFDYVFVESVGGGQLDYELAYFTDTFVYVTVPGLGDEIQVMKAGAAELADIIVVNKRDIAYTGALAELYRRYVSERAGWLPRVIEFTSYSPSDVSSLASLIAEHREHVLSHPEAAGDRRLTAIALLALGIAGQRLDDWKEDRLARGIGAASDLDLLEDALGSLGIKPPGRSKADGQGGPHRDRG